jgi:D-3-phosphoglycerate dehydrogenase
VGGSTQEAQEEIGTFVATKLLGFVEGGATSLSVNLPEVPAPSADAAFRLGYLHHNVPGVLASINQTLAESGVNVTGQSLSTRGDLGYVVTDTDVAPAEPTLDGLRDLDQTIWLRTWTA